MAGSQNRSRPTSIGRALIEFPKIFSRNSNQQDASQRGNYPHALRKETPMTLDALDDWSSITVMLWHRTGIETAVKD